MRSAFLALLFAVALPAQGGQYNISFGGGGVPTHVSAITWNGQPALLILTTRGGTFATFWPPALGQRVVALDVMLGVVTDSRPCAVGNAWGVGDNGGWWFGGKLIPPSGVELFTLPTPWTMQYRPVTNPFTPSGYEPNYCRFGVLCSSGCVTGGFFDAPDLVAVICTARFL